MSTKTLITAAALLTLASTAGEARWYAANAGPVLGIDGVGVCAPLDQIDFNGSTLQTPTAFAAWFAKRDIRMVRTPHLPAWVVEYYASLPHERPSSRFIFFNDQDICQEMAAMLDKQAEIRAHRTH